MDVDGLQTSQQRKKDAFSEKVCVGVFDVTRDSYTTQAAKR